MYGFIVTTHYNNYETISKCLKLLFENIPNDSYVILYVNETKCPKVLNIANDFSILEIETENENINENKNEESSVYFDVIYIDNQDKNNGLTGTWNRGIDYLIDKGVKVITILGHDTFVNKSINKLLEKGLEAENKKKLEYYGPLFKNYKGKNDELWQDEIHYKKYLKDYFLIGSIFTFPVSVLKANILYSKKNEIGKCNADKCNADITKMRNYYFDEERFPFGYNDIDWYNRFKKKGGKAVKVTDCIIDHKYERTWMAVDKNLKNFNKKSGTGSNESNGSNENSEFDTTNFFLKFKIEEMKFDWKNYIKLNKHYKNMNHIHSEKQAFVHYLTIGIHNKLRY